VLKPCVPYGRLTAMTKLNWEKEADGRTFATLIKCLILEVKSVGNTIHDEYSLLYEEMVLWLRYELKI
jgi:hypothetical protein